MIGIVFTLGVGPVLVSAGSTTIEVGHNRLRPAEISISVGDQVTFHNTDTMPGGHTIIADDKSFKSPPLGREVSWSHLFTKEGTFRFHIKQHPGAKGKIVVQEN